MPVEVRNSHPHRLLIIEENRDIVRLMLGGLGRDCCDATVMAGRAAQRPAACRCNAPCCIVIASLRDLHRSDLSAFDVVICASSLPDGSGLDALAYVRGVRPELCVILTGEVSDTPLAIEAIRAGAVDFLVATRGDLRTLPLAVEKCLAHQRIRLENDRLQVDLSRSLAETAVKNRQLQGLIERLETLTRTDELTGLCNRRWLNMALERAWAESLRHGTPLAFAMIDLDGFKAINDQFGHQRGDEALQLSARVLQANSRSVDLPARYGGDEFCILMPQTQPHDAVRVSQRIVEAFQTAFDGWSVPGSPLGMSIGLSHVEVGNPASITQLIAQADEALYAAKAAGKNRVVLFGTPVTAPVS